MSPRKHLPAGIAVAVLLAGLLLFPWNRPSTITVAVGDDLQAELDSAPEGAIVVIEPGRHSGNVVVDRPVTITGLAGASLVSTDFDSPVISVLAGGTAVENLELVGGSSGLVVREADGVVVRDLRISGSDLHGIEVVDASAHISGARISDMRHPMAQGIEVRNSDGRPDTVVESSTVTGGQEGIVSHVSEVVFRDNVVRETTMRGITITEMSDGVVAGNTITDATGAGLYCGDMSRCEFSDNDIAPVAADSAGRPTEGWGLVVTYHAVASTDDDRLSGESGPLFTSTAGRVREDSPLDPRATPATWLPVVAGAALALSVVGVLYLLGRRLAPRLRPTPGRELTLVKPGALTALVLTGLGIQTFHMAEHALQVFRVRIDQIPSRGGIVGPVVEAEWIHFLYNLFVVAAIGLIAVGRARGWRPRGRVDVGDRLLVAGLAIQSYHAIEHSAKLVQHLTGGAKVNPGFAGEIVDLVLFHFSINLAVYVALVGAALAYAWPLLKPFKESVLHRTTRPVGAS